MATLTSANSVYALVIANLYPAPVILQGYAADDMFRTAVVRPVEVQMGVDAILSGGWTAAPKVQNISLAATSESNLIFEQWYNAQQQAREVYIANAIITVPAISQVYTATKGFLTGYPPMADARRLLQPRVYEITWGEIIGAPTALAA
jgi:hypothetical protein